MNAKYTKLKRKYNSAFEVSINFLDKTTKKSQWKLTESSMSSHEGQTQPTEHYKIFVTYASDKNLWYKIYKVYFNLTIK